MRRLVSLALAALGVIGIVLVLPARPALAQPAHPLGNFSVNQAIGLDLYPDRVAVTAIVDLAELPTLQERPAVDTNSDGTVSAPESAAYNTRVCNAMAGAVALRVDGHRVQWSVRPAGFAYRPGSAGLHTSRVSCAFKAAADLTRPATADLVNGYRADRIGWREITAAGHGVHIVHPQVPVRSVTNSLRSYPADLLGSPLDQRSARLQVEPGDGPSAGRGHPRECGRSGEPLGRTSGSGAGAPGRRASHPVRRRCSRCFSRSRSAPRTLPCPGTERR